MVFLSAVVSLNIPDLCCDTSVKKKEKKKEIYHRITIGSFSSGGCCYFSGNQSLSDFSSFDVTVA